MTSSPGVARPLVAIMLFGRSIYDFVTSRLIVMVFDSKKMHIGTMKTNEIKEKIRHAFNSFDGSSADLLEDFYSSDAVFQDPIRKVSGLNGIKEYYRGVYKNVKSISFDFSEIHHEGSIYYATWTLNMEVRGLNFGKPYSVDGISVLTFGEDGKVIHHRDYLDLGEMVYEKIPVLGSVVSLLRKALAH